MGSCPLPFPSVCPMSSHSPRMTVFLKEASVWHGEPGYRGGQGYSGTHGIQTSAPWCSGHNKAQLAKGWSSHTCSLF